MPETCATCRFWHPSPSSGHIGSCRRHAPALGRYQRAAWPETTADDACGSHKARGASATTTTETPPRTAR